MLSCPSFPALPDQVVLPSTRTADIIRLRRRRGDNGNWSIYVKCVCDLEGPPEMTNLSEATQRRCQRGGGVRGSRAGRK